MLLNCHAMNNRRLLMKIFLKTAVTTVFCLFSIWAFPQSVEQRKNDSVFTLVYKYFNERQAEPIYELAGEVFRKNN